MHPSEILLELNEVPQRKHITPAQMLQVFLDEDGDSNITIHNVTKQFRYLVDCKLLTALGFEGDCFNEEDQFILSDYWRSLTLKQKVVWYNKP